MKKSKSSSPDVLLCLEDEQRRAHKRSKKVDRAREQLDRRLRRLAATESRVARLEAILAAPRKERLGDHAESDGALQDALLIFNPGAGRDSEDNALRLAQVVSALRAHGVRARTEIKTSGKAARAQARELVKAGGGLLIVAGGDGTIGDVAAELVGSDVVLGIIPLGTMNNLARSLGVPLDIEAACALIGIRTTRRIDAGRLSSTESPDVQYFFDCAGVGLLAVAAVAGQAFEKHHWRVLPGAIRKFFESRLGTVQVEMDGRLLAASTCMVTISNAPLMGNKLLAAPGARMDDGFLDVAVYDGMGNVALAEHFLAAAAGRADAVPCYQARSIRITAEEALPSSADMNVNPVRHVIEVAVVPRAVEVIVGNGIGLTTPVLAAPAAPPFAPDPRVVTPASAPVGEDGLANGA